MGRRWSEACCLAHVGWEACWRHLASAERCHGDRAPDKGNLREEGFLWIHGAISVSWQGRQGFWETLCDGNLSQFSPLLVDQEAESSGQC